MKKKHLQLIAMASSLLLGGTTSLRAQAISTASAGGGEATLTYQWVHSNTQPGQCGCFGLNGLGIALTRNLGDRWAATIDVSSGHTSNGPGTGASLTLTSYMGGARYYVPPSWIHVSESFRPFGEVLGGVAHAGGGVAGVGDGHMALAARMGGGFDVPFSPKLTLRLIQIDYYMTEFDNGTNNRQNNYLVGTGVSYRWGSQY